MASVITRRNVLSLAPGAAAVALAPASPAASAPTPTPAAYDAAWQGLAEVLWKGRADKGWDMLSTASGRSAASEALQYAWEHPEANLGRAHNIERDVVGKMIATGRFWPLA